MVQTRRQLVLAGLVVALGGGAGLALAQPSGPMGGPMGGAGPGAGMGAGMGAGRGPGMMGGRGGRMMGARMGMAGGYRNAPAYLADLKAQLGITNDQTPAWQAYAETVSGTATQMQGLHQSMYQSMAGATWAERRERMNVMFQARQQAFETVHAAAEKLLPALSAQQRETAAYILPGLRGPGPMGGGMGRGMMGGPGAPAPAIPPPAAPAPPAKP